VTDNTRIGEEVWVEWGGGMKGALRYKGEEEEQREEGVVPLGVEEEDGGGGEGEKRRQHRIRKIRKISEN